LLECRGIKFNKNGSILARPFKKFFNYGEKSHEFPISLPHIITEKIDGSMVHPVLLNGNLFLHTRKGHTEVALQAEKVLNQLNVNFIGFMKFYIKKGWTPIFEYIGPSNRIIIEYDKENLILLAMRNTIYGNLMPYDELVKASSKYNIPVVRPPALYNKPVTNIDLFLDHVRNLKDIEGYVVKFDNDYMVKIKATDYVIKHRAASDFNSKKKIVKLCTDGLIDDLLPLLNENDKKELLNFNSKLLIMISNNVEEVNKYKDKFLKIEKKEKENARKWFAQNIVKYADPKLKPAIFGSIDGKDIRQMIINNMVKNVDKISIKWKNN